MSFSLYFEAVRSCAVTAEEQDICRTIIDEFSSKYPYRRTPEEFDISDSDNAVLCGSIKLPDRTVEEMFETAVYWLECLTKISEAIDDAQWSVMFDEVPLIWDTERGWRFPSDDEYGQG